MKNPDLHILIPAYAEGERLAKTLDQLAQFLSKYPLGKVAVTVAAGHKVGEVNDVMAQIIKDRRRQFAQLDLIDAGEHPGGLKGQDVKLGMLKIAGRYKLFMDADLATPLHHLVPLVEQLRQGTDIVIGERDLAKIHNTRLRQFISVVGNLTLRLLLGMSYRDTQCGFKGFQAAVADDLFSAQRIRGWGFDMELLAIARQRHYQVAKLKIPDWRDVAGGTLSGAAAQAVASTLKDVLTIRWNLWRGRYRRH